MKICSRIGTFLKKRENCPIIISVLALMISLGALLLGSVNFYWTFLKDRKVLHLAYVDEIAEMHPQFAIVNGGKKDLLITNLTCLFGNMKETGRSFTPAQTIELQETDSYLLPSEKGFYCKVRFNERFTSSFAKTGIPESVHNKELYMHDMYVDISWVEMDGKCHNKSIKLIKYGFNENGDIGYRAPLGRLFNLYK